MLFDHFAERTNIKDWEYYFLIEERLLELTRSHALEKVRFNFNFFHLPHFDAKFEVFQQAAKRLAVDQINRQRARAGNNDRFQDIV